MQILSRTSLADSIVGRLRRLFSSIGRGNPSSRLSFKLLLSTHALSACHIYCFCNFASAHFSHLRISSTLRLEDTTGSSGASLRFARGLKFSSFQSCLSQPVIFVSFGSSWYWAKSQSIGDNSPHRWNIRSIMVPGGSLVCSLLPGGLPFQSSKPGLVA